MPTSIVELNQFVEFATGMLNAGAADASIEQLLKQWREQREYDETVSEIRQGLKDYEDGKFRPVDEVFADIRRKLGLES